MSHIRVRAGNSPIVHAALQHPASFLFCQLTIQQTHLRIDLEKEKPEPTNDLVTCEVCRAFLAELWRSWVDYLADQDRLIQFSLDDDGNGPSRVRILARREVEGKGPFIRFARRWDDGQEILGYYTLERFINLLIDGNANIRRQERGDIWQHQPEASNYN